MGFPIVCGAMSGLTEALPETCRLEHLFAMYAFAERESGLHKERLG